MFKPLNTAQPFDPRMDACLAQGGSWDVDHAQCAFPPGPFCTANAHIDAQGNCVCSQGYVWHAASATCKKMPDRDVAEALYAIRDHHRMQHETAQRNVALVRAARRGQLGGDDGMLGGGDICGVKFFPAGWGVIDVKNQATWVYTMQGETLCDLSVTYCQPPCNPTQVGWTRDDILKMNKDSASYNTLWNNKNISGLQLRMSLAMVTRAIAQGATYKHYEPAGVIQSPLQATQAPGPGDQHYQAGGAKSGIPNRNPAGHALKHTSSVGDPDVVEAVRAIRVNDQMQRATAQRNVALVQATRRGQLGGTDDAMKTNGLASSPGTLGETMPNQPRIFACKPTTVIAKQQIAIAVPTPGNPSQPNWVNVPAGHALPGGWAPDKVPGGWIVSILLGFWKPGESSYAQGPYPLPYDVFDVHCAPARGHANLAPAMKRHGVAGAPGMVGGFAQVTVSCLPITIISKADGHPISGWTWIQNGSSTNSQFGLPNTPISYTVSLPDGVSAGSVQVMCGDAAEYIVNQDWCEHQAGMTWSGSACVESGGKAAGQALALAIAKAKCEKLKGHWNGTKCVGPYGTKTMVAPSGARIAMKRPGVAGLAGPACNYTTQRGDTLRSIARRLGVHVNVLHRLNPDVTIGPGRPMDGGFTLAVPCHR